MRILAVGDSNATEASFISEAARILSAELIDWASPGICVSKLVTILNTAKYEADLAVMLIGTNDVPEVNRIGVDAFNKSYILALDLLVSSYNRVIACTVPPYGTGGQTEVVKEMNREIIRLCIIAGAELFDLHAILADADGIPIYPKDYIDGLHLSAFGRVRAGLALAMQIAGSTVGREMDQFAHNRYLATPPPLTAFLIGRRVPVLFAFACWTEARRLASLGFDERYYVEKNVDVTLFKVDPIRHFILSGRLEGRLFRFIR
jgi:hypothetical protein